jgi:DNA-binding transcriptional LysR family regulator
VKLQEARPGIRVALELGTSARAVEALRSHRAELGVVGGFVAAPDDDATARELISDHLKARFRPRHRQATANEATRLSAGDLRSAL